MAFCGVTDLAIIQKDKNERRLRIVYAMTMCDGMHALEDIVYARKNLNRNQGLKIRKNRKCPSYIV